MSMSICIVTILYTLDMRYIDVNAYREMLEALTEIAIWSKKKDRFPGHRDVYIYIHYTYYSILNFLQCLYMVNVETHVGS